MPSSFIEAASTALKSLTSTKQGKSIGAETLKKLETIGHQNVIFTSTGLPHKVLGLSREQLRTLRISPEEAGQLNLIEKGILPAAQQSATDFTPRKIVFENKTRLVCSLTSEERTFIFSCPNWIREYPTSNGEATLHLAEQRSIQDYMSVPDQSLIINRFLRGEQYPSAGLATPSDLKDFSLLMISGLNALPAQATVSMHSLPRSSVMFKAMMKAATEGKPFCPDHFMSTTKMSEEHAQDQYTPPNTSRGDTAVMVHSHLAKNVSKINQVYAQENELIIAPFVDFDVQVHDLENQNKPALILTERSKTN
ncbi:MAG: hypothetical protein R3194_14160 [Limnobacter sp.]|nr:hypothetical protein [Limnobacter sp.]